MSPIYPAGEASMEEAQALHRQRIAEARAEHLEAAVDALQVGQVVWERRVDGTNHALKGGVVVHITDPDETGEARRCTIVDVARRSKPGTTINVWDFTVHHLYVSDIGEVRPTGSAAHMSYARALFHCIGSRSGWWADVDDRLLGWAMKLKEAS